MRDRLVGYWQRLSLYRQFMVTSLAVLLACMVAIGWWVGQAIKVGVLNRSAATTALYVDSFVAPQLQEYGQTGQLLPQRVEALSRLLQDTPLGQQIVKFKVWDREGRILFSTSPAIVGQAFLVDGDLAKALNGQVAVGISDLTSDENVLERERFPRLIESYIPVRLDGSSRVIAVAEFYQTVDGLEQETAAAQLGSWLIIAAVTVVAYALLAGLVRRGSDTIHRQQAQLGLQVDQLTALLIQNEELHERVRRAATRATEVNERFLRRISADLHDGPAQDLGLSLLRLDTIIARTPECERSAGSQTCTQDLETIQLSLRRALQEVRTIASGLRLPELEALTPAETLARVVRVHERRTDTRVAVEVEGELPEVAPLPVKITLYRLVQEALTNAYRHGGGVGQKVRVAYDVESMTVEVSDGGPGFDWARISNRSGHLGLVGMRERVESLGGIFRVDTESGRGTRVIARLSLSNGAGTPGSEDERG